MRIAIYIACKYSVLIDTIRLDEDADRTVTARAMADRSRLLKDLAPGLSGGKRPPRRRSLHAPPDRPFAQPVELALQLAVAAAGS